MKRFALTLLIALVLASTTGAYATTGPDDPTPTDPGANPDTRGPIDPFPPPTLAALLALRS